MSREVLERPTVFPLSCNVLYIYGIPLRGNESEGEFKVCLSTFYLV